MTSDTIHRHHPALDPASSAAADAVRPEVIASLDPSLVVTFASLAIRHGEDGVHCGLSLVPARRAPETIAATDGLPVQLDWLQQELRQGPCVSAHGATIRVSPDLANDGRWPDFGRLCVAAHNVRSLVSLSASLRGRGQVALNFYAEDASAPVHLDLAAAVKLLRLAAPSALELLDRLGDTLRDADDTDFSRTAVAVSIVMAHYRVSSNRAFDLLKEAARVLRRPLLDVAIQTVRSGGLPGAFHPRIRDWIEAIDAGAGQREPGSARPIGHLGGPDLWRDWSEAPAVG